MRRRPLVFAFVSAPADIYDHSRDAALHRAPRGPRPPVGRVGSRNHTTPLWPPRRSLESNSLNDQAKQAIKDAVGSDIKIEV